jgi:regulatory protein
MFQKELKQAQSIKNVYNSAYWHLSNQDYTIAEIRKKLERKTDNSEWVETVLADLANKGYTKKDFDFAVRLAESMFSNEYGSAAIKRKLCLRGIPERESSEAVEQVMLDGNIDQLKLVVSRINNSFQNFNSTTKEKLYSQLTSKGFSRSEIDHAIANHPEKHTLRNKLQVKAEKAVLEDEILKLYRKGKGKSLIRQELRSKLLDVSGFEEKITCLEENGDIDFYQSCKEALEKKRFDLTIKKIQSKAYSFLMGKGFSSDEIKEAFLK